MKVRSRSVQPPWLVFSDLLGNSFFLVSLMLGLQIVVNGINKEPPVISLEDSKIYKFEIGSYNLSNSFRRTIDSSIAPKILDLLKHYPGVSSVEVIGHTDGVPIGSISNLDTSRITSQITQSTSEYIAGSNVDLGLLRALAVKSALQSSLNQICHKQVRNNGCRKINYRVYSAGSLIDLNGNITPANGRSDPSRRRIEIRFTR